MASCATKQIQLNDRTVISNAIDLRDYANKGFMFTVGDYTYNYDSIGIISITIWPKVEKYQGGAENKGYVVVKDSRGFNGAMYKPLALKEIFDEAFKKATSMGADGLIQMEITYPENTQGVQGLKINGLAINRNE